MSVPATHKLLETRHQAGANPVHEHWRTLKILKESES